MDFDYSTFSNFNTVYKLAKKLGVSALAFVTRSYNLNLISNTKYSELKVAAKDAYNEYVKREEAKVVASKNTDGGPSYYRLMLSKNGKLFTQIVLNYFKSGLINPTTASSLLDVKVNNFSKLDTFINT